jgi:hypothetical protein
VRERRKHPRHIKGIRVILRARVPGSEGGVAGTQICAGTTRNVSVGGLRLRVDRPFLLGTPLVLTLAWDDPPGAFELQGRVVWVRGTEAAPSEIGVRFTPGDPQRWNAWVACCETSLPHLPVDAIMDFINDDAGAPSGARTFQIDVPPDGS